MNKEQKRLVDRYFYSTYTKPEGLLPSLLKTNHASLHGEVRLLVAVMNAAILDRDREYILGGGLKEHCRLLSLNYKSVQKACLLMVK